MEQSEYSKGLLANIKEQKNADYEGEFGRVVKEYTLQFPNGTSCRGIICCDAYAQIDRNENQRRLDDMWKVARTIHLRHCSTPELPSHVK